jgi:c-di-AMP phosphodiesterase-like protein
MKRKLRRVTQPNILYFFPALILFALGAFFLGEYILGLCELAVTAGLYALLQVRSLRRKKTLTEYIRANNAMLGKLGDKEVPFPVAMIHLETMEIHWHNKPFGKLFQLRDQMDPHRLKELIPTLDLSWLKDGMTEAPEDLQYRGRRFQVTGSLLPHIDPKGDLFFGMIYLRDQTELLQVRDEYIRSRPLLSIVVVDNFDELANTLPDAETAGLTAQINTKINEWAEANNGLMRKMDRNRFLLLFEVRDLAAMAERKFELLDSIRSIQTSNGLSPTVSIGLGKDGVDFRENYKFAALSIDMALSRGGDQAVLKDRNDFSFYGGRNNHADRHSKVRSRTAAKNLAGLISEASRVFIMGHRMADLDALGAAVGVYCLCRKLGKKANIVIDSNANAAQALLAQLRALPEYADCFISGQDALVEADLKSYLIVVDTNRPDQVECKPLLESLRRVAIIDHHRRAADYIEGATPNMHEPRASSASELVAEILQYTVEPDDILPEEAMALLAGIALDTKHFGVRTNSYTFEAAAFLRRLGADPVEVKKLFQNDLPSTVARYKIIQNAKQYRHKIAIAALDYTVNRTLAAQAADELINISGIEASFVLYPQDDQTIISARSIGDANVQVILEALGGGGNAATAGAQVKNRSVSATLQDLTRSIDKFFES